MTTKTFEDPSLDSLIHSLGYFVKNSISSMRQGIAERNAPCNWTRMTEVSFGRGSISIRKEEWLSKMDGPLGSLMDCWVPPMNPGPRRKQADQPTKDHQKFGRMLDVGLEIVRRSDFTVRSSASFYPCGVTD